VQRQDVCDFSAGAIDEQYGTLLHAAIPFPHHAG
jgi:hypothetical protein